MHYHLMLSEIDLISTRHISAAGAFKAQDWTPAFDAETIVYGRTRQEMPGSIRPILDTGAVSPAILVHELLSQINAWSEPVHLHIHNLGLNHPPLIDDTPTPWASVNYYGWPLSPTEFEPLLTGGEVVFKRQGLLPEICTVFADLLHSQRGQTLIIAECVPGGTTTAEVWWSMLSGDRTPTPSSSTEGDVQDRKRRTVEDLRNWIATHISYYPRRPDHIPGDNFQLLLRDALIQLMNRPNADQRILLGGGSQMGAVLMAVQKILDMKYCRYNIAASTPWEWWTTPWIAKGWPPSHLANSNKVPLPVRAVHDFSLANAKCLGLALYEQGYVKEGLGLGAVIAQAKEHLNLNSAELATLVDELCRNREDKHARSLNHACHA